MLRDLRAALPRLGATDRAAAESLLARPTDGRADPEGTGYTTKSQRRCRGHFCVHYVTSTSDRATSAWVDKTLKVMKKVWQREVGDLGYRAPLSDGALPSSRNGGNGKFDVYLADVGADLLYGYCSADFVLRKDRTRAGGYCVLDNDFSKDQYGGKPGKTLAVTAAHEFFHAIQFGYDYYEDRWFMESTATWVEERFADGVNDNRQYLAFGQVAAPDTSLDLFERGGFAHYGNWPFWEHLSERYGDAIVRRTWTTARGSTYSTRAVEKVLEDRGGFAKRLAAFSAANLTPGDSYPEGDHWPAAEPEATWTFGRRTAPRSDEVDVDHMASASYVAVPDATLTSEGFGGAPYRLRLTVDGPRAKTSPTAWLVVRTVDGEWRSEQVDLVSARGLLRRSHCTRVIVDSSLSLSSDSLSRCTSWTAMLTSVTSRPVIRSSAAMTLRRIPAARSAMATPYSATMSMSKTIRLRPSLMMRQWPSMGPGSALRTKLMFRFVVTDSASGPACDNTQT